VCRAAVKIDWVKVLAQSWSPRRRPSWPIFRCSTEEAKSHTQNNSNLASTKALQPVATCRQSSYLRPVPSASTYGHLTAFNIRVYRFTVTGSSFHYLSDGYCLHNYLISTHSISSFFTARRSYASAVLGVLILFVSHACFAINPKNLLPAIFLYHLKGQSL